MLQLNAVLKRERETSEATDIIAQTFRDTLIAEVEKNAALQEQISDKPAIQNCDENDAGHVVAYLSVDAIRMLNQCSQTAALPETQEQGFVTQDKVTSSDLARYACKAISEYNRCAIEVNNAIEENIVEMKYAE